MSFHFYLSYAPSDYSEDLQVFLEDLQCTIRARLHHSEEQAEFVDPQGTTADLEWSADMSDALRTSHAMIALISPAYIRSASFGKQWQIFEMRRRCLVEAPPCIVPVLWVPCDDPLPKAISEAG